MKKFLFLLMAMIAFGFQSVNAQDGMKIVSNHPDFKIKVKRCAASGKTVIIDLVLTNEGATDVEKIEGGGGYWDSEAYDDEGNIYQYGDVKVRVANREEYEKNGCGEFKIPVGVPMKFSISLENVPASAESIARLSLVFKCEKWNLNDDKPVKISNIPISRN